MPARVSFVGENRYGGADDLVQRTTRPLENGLDVGQALPGLFLNGGSLERAGGGVGGAVPETNTRPAAFTAWL